MSTTLVLGGPGTGKTTHLIGVVKAHLDAGANPKRIAYLAFTRKAAIEAKDRTLETLGLDADDLPWFRTIHSFAFACLGLSIEEVMRKTDYRELGAALGEQLTIEEDETGAPVGHRLVFLDHYSRATGVPLENLCGIEKDNVWRARHYAQTLRDFKAARHMVDYTDMLERLDSGEGELPELDVVIVDEAQDLTALQWRVIARISKRVPSVYIGGDDWQAVFAWSGADIHHFLRIQGRRVILAESHRCSSEVHRVALAIGQRIGARIDKSWLPKQQGGYVGRVSIVEDIDPASGSWLMLARHQYGLTPYVESLKRRGYPYMRDGKSSVDTEEVKALILWEKLRRGEVLLGREVELIYPHLVRGSVARGYRKPKVAQNNLYSLLDLRNAFGLLTDKDWMVSIDMTPDNREYIRAIRLRGESLIKTPRITVSTIHGAKGGEADSVSFTVDLSNKAYASYRKNHDAEDRCFFVAASRAKQNLLLVKPQTQRSYVV